MSSAVPQPTSRKSSLARLPRSQMRYAPNACAYRTGGLRNNRRSWPIRTQKACSNMLCLYRKYANVLASHRPSDPRFLNTSGHTHPSEDMTIFYTFHTKCQNGVRQGLRAVSRVHTTCSTASACWNRLGLNTFVAFFLCGTTFAFKKVKRSSAVFKD